MGHWVRMDGTAVPMEGAFRDRQPFNECCDDPVFESLSAFGRTCGECGCRWNFGGGFVNRCDRHGPGSFDPDGFNVESYDTPEYEAALAEIEQHQLQEAFLRSG